MYPEPGALSITVQVKGRLLSLIEDAVEVITNSLRSPKPTAEVRIDLANRFTPGSDERYRPINPPIVVDLP